MQAEVFLDTAYAIALSSPNDLFHNRAVPLADEVIAGGVRWVTTRAVVLEIGNALAKQRYRQAAVKLLKALEADSSIEILPLTEQIYEQAWRLYRRRPDKEWGLTDCISFVVMQEHGLTEVLSTDEHFQQAGFWLRMR